MGNLKLKHTITAAPSFKRTRKSSQRGNDYNEAVVSFFFFLSLVLLVSHFTTACPSLSERNIKRWNGSKMWIKKNQSHDYDNNIRREKRTIPIA